MLIPLYLRVRDANERNDHSGWVARSVACPVRFAGNNSGGDQSRKELNDAYAQLAAKNDQGAIDKAQSFLAAATRAGRACRGLVCQRPGH